MSSAPENEDKFCEKEERNVETKALNKTFMQCMAAFLRGEPIASLSLPSPAWAKLYGLAKRQSLSGALFTVTEHLEMPEAARARLRRDGFLSIAMAEEQHLACRDIAKALSDKCIPHVFFKGAVLRRYYRQPAMRSMGDIDMAVRESDRLRADAVMAELGFACTEKTAEVWVYERRRVMVEIHTVVRRFDVRRQETAIYDTLWQDARRQDGETYVLSDEAEILHVIHHLAAHFSAGGCGVRQVMDVAVLYDRFAADEALWSAVMKELERQHLAAFTKRLLYLCDVWGLACVDQAHEEEVDTETEERMLLRLLGGGTFGKDERMRLSEQRREARGGQRRWRRWFPTVESMKRRFAYVQKHPWLLPVSYVHRFWQGATKNRRIHEKRRQYASLNEAELETEIALFDAMGL